jgi:hypothetical protein
MKYYAHKSTDMLEHTFLDNGMDGYVDLCKDLCRKFMKSFDESEKYNNYLGPCEVARQHCNYKYNQCCEESL